MYTHPHRIFSTAQNEENRLVSLHFKVYLRLYKANRRRGSGHGGGPKALKSWHDTGSHTVSSPFPSDHFII